MGHPSFEGWVGKNRQRQKQMQGVLRFAQNDGFFDGFFDDSFFDDGFFDDGFFDDGFFDDGFLDDGFFIVDGFS